MDLKKKQHLEYKAKEIRRQIVKAIGEAGQGHIGGCLSIVEILTVLYFDEMNIDPQNPNMEKRDRLILSKGHAGPALYATLALAGYFDIDCLKTLNKPHTNLPSHCDMTKTLGIDMTAGSLGQGLSCAVGVAKAAKIMSGDEYIYAIIGDGESQEGAIWEASMAASQYKLDNLIVFLDHNELQVDGSVNDIMSLIDPIAKWEAFGFRVLRADGHDVDEISHVIAKAKKEKDARPSMIVLDTVKGKGIPFIEAIGAANHSMALSAEQVELALAQIDGEVA
jgi:transketolase